MRPALVGLRIVVWPKVSHVFASNCSLQAPLYSQLLASTGGASALHTLHRQPHLGLLATEGYECLGKDKSIRTGCIQCPSPFTPHKERRGVDGLVDVLQVTVFGSPFQCPDIRHNHCITLPVLWYTTKLGARTALCCWTTTILLASIITRCVRCPRAPLVPSLRCPPHPLTRSSAQAGRRH